MMCVADGAHAAIQGNEAAVGVTGRVGTVVTAVLTQSPSTGVHMYMIIDCCK